MGKKAVHIFHHNDLDGRAAGGLWYEYFDRYRDDVEMYFMHEVDYTMKLDTEIHKGDVVVFVDYSFSSMNNIEYFKKLISNGYEIYWVDHHKTSQDLLNEFCKSGMQFNRCHVYINMDFCAAALSYNYIMTDILDKHPDTYETPAVIKYVDSYDCWKFDMPNTKAFHYGMLGRAYTAKGFFRNVIFSCDKSFNIFEYGAREQLREYESMGAIIAYGKNIEKYDEVSSMKWRDACGFPVMIIDNANTGCYIGYAMNIRGNSFVFGDKIKKYDFVMPFFYKNNNVWKYSLFSENGTDCEYLAKMFGKAYKLGGGGHKNAAGFQSATCIFDRGDQFYINKVLFKKEPVLISGGYMTATSKNIITQAIEHPEKK